MSVCGETLNGTLERNPAPSGAGQPSYVFFSGVEERPPLTVEESPSFKEEFFNAENSHSPLHRPPLSFHIALLPRKVDGFSVALIHSGLTFNPAWETAPASPELDPIFSQKFHYLGCGGQSFAFVSDDGQYVIKFFKFRLFRQPYHFFLTMRRCLAHFGAVPSAQTPPDPIQTSQGFHQL